MWHLLAGDLDYSNIHFQRAQAGHLFSAMFGNIFINEWNHRDITLI